MSAALVALILLAGCQADSNKPVDGAAGPAAPSTTPEAQETDISLAPLPRDVVVVSKTGKASLTAPIRGKFGPDYVLYARCRGGSGLEVSGIGKEPWLVPCDGVPSRVTNYTEKAAVSLRLTTGTDVNWTFLVARQKPA